MIIQTVLLLAKITLFLVLPFWRLIEGLDVQTSTARKHFQTKWIVATALLYCLHCLVEAIVMSAGWRLIVLLSLTACLHFADRALILEKVFRKVGSLGVLKQQ